MSRTKSGVMASEGTARDPTPATCNRGSSVVRDLRGLVGAEEVLDRHLGLDPFRHFPDSRAVHGLRLEEQLLASP